MNRIAFLTSVLLSFFTVTLHAQSSYSPPGAISLQSREDYVKTEPDIIAASAWLESTPLNQEPEKRKAANSFIIKWASGTPTVNIDITSALTKIYGKNINLLPVYMAGYCAYAIEHPSEPKAAFTKGGIYSMMKLYKTETGIIKNKEMERILAMTEPQLDEYVAKKF